MTSLTKPHKIIKRIFSVKIYHTPNEFPASLLGNYDNFAKSNYSIERENAGPRECRYFNPNWRNYKGCTEKEILRYCQQDYERMEKYNNGHWYLIEIGSRAKVGISMDGGKTFKLDTLTSGGLWGIESDSGGRYITEVEQQELVNLKEILIGYGFGRCAVARAIKNAERN